MSKVTANPDTAVQGKEPVWSKKEHNCSINEALNWYSYFHDTGDSKKWLLVYLKDTKAPTKTLEVLSRVPDQEFKNIGFVARMLTRGMVDKTSKESVQKYVQKLMALKPSVVAVEKNAPPKLNIQDHIAAQASLAIGEIEGAIDDFDFSTEKLECILEEFKVKAPQALRIVKFFDKRLKFVEECLVSKDPELKGAYAHLSKKELKDYVVYLNLILTKCKQVKVNAVVSRKPRAKKVKAASVVVSKMKYLKGDNKLKVVSVNPESIVGANQLWVFNVKTRKLGVYNSDGGLTVKGCTLQNFDESTSVQKTVRKPEVKVPEVVLAGKVALRKLMPDINAVETALTGRINKDTLLLRVV